MLEVILGLSFLAFLSTLVSLPYVGDFMKKRGYVGRDLHKEGRPEVPENGGMAVWASFVVIAFAYSVLTRDPWVQSVVLAAFLMGLLGIIDRVRRLSAAVKLPGFLLLGAALAWWTPITGHAAGGIILFLIFPIVFMAGANFTNMLAGFNGLEIGTGAMASFGIATIAYIRGDYPALAAALILASALLAFLYCNRYPATIFPGDVGTLIIGAVLVPCIFHAGAFLAGLIIFLPYIIDAGLKFATAGIMTREAQKPTEVKDGKLYLPEGGNLSLARLFLKWHPMGEKEVVAAVWAVEATVVIAAIAVERGLG
jgi:UDP-N-acetylglucosamine--dolichyl-phosphate N-acetylglucosaminephosphotransferase